MRRDESGDFEVTPIELDGEIGSVGGVAIASKRAQGATGGAARELQLDNGRHVAARGVPLGCCPDHDGFLLGECPHPVQGVATGVAQRSTANRGIMQDRVGCEGSVTDDRTGHAPDPAASGVPNDRRHFSEERMMTVVERFDQAAPGALRSRDHCLGFARGRRCGLLDEHVLTCFQRGDRPAGVVARGVRDVDGVERRVRQEGFVRVVRYGDRPLIPEGSSRTGAARSYRHDLDVRPSTCRSYER